MQRSRGRNGDPAWPCAADLFQEAPGPAPELDSDSCAGATDPPSPSQRLTWSRTFRVSRRRRAERYAYDHNHAARARPAPAISLFMSPSPVVHAYRISVVPCTGGCGRTASAFRVGASRRPIWAALRLANAGVKVTCAIGKSGCAHARGFQAGPATARILLRFPSARRLAHQLLDHSGLHRTKGTQQRACGPAAGPRQGSR